MSTAVEVFISYSHKDEELCERLRTHLALLQRLGHITDWHDRKITAGSEWAGAIDEHLRSARIILLLISADFLASDYCYDIETKLALDRHAAGEAIVIPVILRPTDWTEAPFAKLEALPRDGKAVTLWTSQDEAFALVSRGIRQAIARLASGGITPEPAREAPAASFLEGERVLDAAVAQQVFVGRPTELLVQVRRTESGGLKALVTEEPEIGIDPEQVRSKPFELTWPLGPDGKPQDVRLQVNVDAPSFQPPRQSKTILVPPDDDSEPYSFLMTPQQTGPLLVQVELQWNEASGPQRTLRTRCEAEGVEAPRPRMNVVTFPAFAAAAATGGGWTTSSTLGYPVTPPAAPAPAPPAPAPRPGPPTLPSREPREAQVQTARPAASTSWMKGAAVAAMLVVAIGIGITQITLMKSPGDNRPSQSAKTQPPPPDDPRPTSPGTETKSATRPSGSKTLPRPSVRPPVVEQPVWLALNRTNAPGGLELSARWNPAWGGDPQAVHGYRITGIPALADLHETVRCGSVGEYKFPLRAARPDVLTAIEVCPLILNIATNTWERIAAPCRTLQVNSR